MSLPAFSVVHTTRTAMEAEMLRSILDRAGLHPLELNTAAHFSLAGAEISFPIEVPSDEADAAKELLAEVTQ
jgi:hypothetical protein